ncbi:MAG: SNF2 helicase associated domain-containing protein [Planctomycetes bacterium]|nr:SNF2 helicase associated domain-containing protein [Planctomycetota bacterium]
MTLVETCSYSFAPMTMSRGRIYFSTGRVELIDGGSEYVCAKVTGSQHTPYAVYVDWSHADDGKISVTCSCPHYDGGDFCKHIWATLLEIDHEKIALGVTFYECDVLHEHDEVEDDDDGWGDDGDYDGPCRAIGPGSVENHFSNQQVPRRKSKRASPTALWQGQLKTISDFATTGSAIESHRAAKQREAWFVLDVGASTSRGKLVVELQQRETKKDGEFGKTKRLSVRRDEIPEFTNEEDGRLIELLLGNRPTDEFYHDSYYSDYQSYNRTHVVPGMYADILPRLCATGRFVWQLDSSLPTEEGTPLTWDGDEPWRFRPRVEDDPKKKCWRFVGELVRGDERIPLGDVVMLLADGAVLYADKLARFDADPSVFGWIVSQRTQGAMEVPYADREKLLESLFRLPRFPEMDLPPSLQVEQIRVAPTGRLEIKSPEAHYDLPNKHLGATVGFLYGERKVALDEAAGGFFDAETNRAVLRDPQREAELMRRASEAGLRWTTSPGHQFDLSFHQKHLADVVARLTEQDWIVETEGVRIRRPGSFKLSVTSGVDWFELDGQLDFDGLSASLPDLLKAVRNKDQYIRLDDGSQGMLPEAWLKKYGYLAEMAQGEGDTLRFAPSQALLLDALLSAQDEVQVDRPFAALRDKLRRFNGVKPCDEPRGFRGELRQYQKEGLGWLHFLREMRLGGCLADDMGLGKTVQVLALLESRRVRRLKKDEHRKPSLVVVPKSLVFNWIDEAARFTPELRMLNYTGTDRKSRLEESDGFDVLITTYGTLRRDVVTLKDMPLDYAILDESQAIKNQTSQAAKASRLINAEHRLAMTGTPIENHLGELWSLFEFLNPGMLGRSTAFKRLTSGEKDADSLAHLASGLRPFMLRRTKDQVLTELPKKTEQTLLCDMSPKQRKEYDALRDYYRINLSDRVKKMGLKKSKIHVLEALLRLRQAACHPGLLDKTKTKELSPKLDVLLEQVREVIAEGHKALVFSQFTSLLSIVRGHLDAENITYEYLDGRTHKREDKVKRFQTDPDCPLFLISLKAGGHGLNLTAADYVFILDPWWNPAVEAQAIDRVHRIGQTRPVFAYRIICRDTVEDKILELQKSKRNLADAIISADSSLLRTLNAADLEMLLS